MQGFSSRSERLAAGLLTAGLFYCFLVFGFSDNLRGPTLPALLADRGLNYAQGGTVLFAGYVGFVIGTLAAGVVAARIGKRMVLVYAGLLLAAGVGAYSLAGGFLSLALASGLMGLGIGCFETGGNALMVDLHSEGRGKYLNLLAVFHSLGAMLVPLYAGALLAGGASWRLVFRFSLPLVLLLPLGLVFMKDPACGAPGGQHTEDGSQPARQPLSSAFRGQKAWFYLLILSYVAAEVGMASWIVEFLNKVKGRSIVEGSLMLSLFFGGILAGRFLGSFLVERAGYLRSILYVSLGGLACVAAGAFGPPALAAMLPIAGLFFSIVFPTATAALSDRTGPTERGLVLGILFACGGVGGMLGPWLIGLLSNWFGLQVGFGALAGYCALVTLAVVALLNRQSPAAIAMQASSGAAE